MSFFSFLGKIALFNMLFKRQSHESENESRQCRHENTDYLRYREFSGDNHRSINNHLYNHHDYEHVDYDDYYDYHHDSHDIYDDIFDDDY